MALCAILLIGISVAIRAFISQCSQNHRWIYDNIFTSTPNSAWKRVEEGIFLREHNVSPYSGNILHEPPLLLIFYEIIKSHIPSLLPLIFLASELVTAFCLSAFVKLYLKSQLTFEEFNQEKNVIDYEKLRINEAGIERKALLSAAIYLLSPYSILCFGAQSTVVLLNAVLALTLYFMMKSQGVLMCLTLSFATYQAIYPASLLLPTLVFVIQDDISKWKSKTAGYICVYLSSLAFLIWSSFYLMGSWDFVRSTYGFIMNVDDLTPNIGLFWYFFTEMFDHFRSFFIFTFQVNAFIYAIPLTICFRKNPVLVIFTLLALTTIFKSYPNVGDVALYTALLPLFSHLYPFTKHIFIIGCVFATCSILGPIQYVLWIYYGSANANFFFGTTLAFNAAQVFLITDVLFGFSKREFHLKHGLKLMIDGEEAKLYLK